MDIVLATRNKKKIEEIRRIVYEMPVSLYSLDDFPGCPEVEEDGNTFEENAVKKARAVAEYTKMPALADDSGLEVYALNNAPGVLSARYAGEGANDMRNTEKLLNELVTVPDGERGARFVCVIAVAFPDGIIRIFSGYAEGTVGRAPKGLNGFGYDPIFYPAGHNRTFAEMSDGEKDVFSHRGKALKKLHEYFKKA